MNKVLRTKLIIASSVAVVTFIVFLPSLQNEFVNWDDNDYVYMNTFIRSLDTELLKSAFGEFYASNWHPLTWISHAFDYAIWGLNPLGHHLTNNILHAVNTFLVVLLVVRLVEASKPASLPASGGATGDQGLQAGKLTSSHDSRFMLIAAGVTGLLFGLHPIHVESVAWVAERKDLLCALFYLLSIMAYMKYAANTPQGPKSIGHSVRQIGHGSRGMGHRVFDTLRFALCSMRFRALLSALCFFFLALLSKPMAVSLPVVLLILDWYPFRRIQSLKICRTTFIEKLPFFVLTLVSSILTIVAQEGGGAIKSLEHIPLASRVATAAKSLVAYLVKMVLPLNLVPFYPYPENISLFSLEYIIPIVVVIAITATCIAVMRKQKLWISVWSYYVITLMPVLGIVQVGHQAMADRYTYLPSLGPFLLMGLMAAIVYERMSALNRGRVLLRAASFLVAMTMLVSISYATITQIGIWKNSIVLWNYVIDREPERVPLAHNNLGQAYLSKGQYDMAIEHIQTALSLKPDDAEAHNNLGAAYFSKGLFDTAIEQYRTALNLKPNLAGAYHNLGYAYLSRGQFDMAIAQFRIALNLRPNDANAYNDLGNAYISIGQFDTAIEQYRTALRLMPNLAEVHNNLGNAYFSIGQLDIAIEQYRTALRLKPDLAGAHYKLGLSYLDKGSRDMARTEFELELRIKPDDYEARRALNSIISE